MRLEMEIARLIDQRLRPEDESPARRHLREWRQQQRGRVRPLAFRFGSWMVDTGHFLQVWSSGDYSPRTAGRVS